MRPWQLILLALAGFATLASAEGAPKAFDPAGSDPQAIAAVDQAQHTLGMPESWHKAHYIEFTFGSARNDSLQGKGRHHCWDTWTGRYRIEGDSRQMKKHYIVIFKNINDPTSAQVWLDGEKQADSTNQKLGKQLYGAYINDTYWLLMPYKMKDPGVHLKWLGMETDSTCMKTCAKVKLSFDEVGLTPKDHYWVYINPEDHMITSWKYFAGEGDQTLVTTWEDWQAHGPLLLSGKRKMPGQPTSMVMGDLVASETVKESAFEGP